MVGPTSGTRRQTITEYADTGKVGISIGGRGRFFRLAHPVEHAGPATEP